MDTSQEVLSPFDRPLDLHLQGLRAHSDDAYRLLPGKGDAPDRWVAKCPMHPDVGFTLILTDQGDDQDPELWCRLGCPEGVIRYALIDNPEREQRARAAAQVLVWAQSYRRAA